MHPILAETPPEWAIPAFLGAVVGFPCVAVAYRIVTRSGNTWHKIGALVIGMAGLCGVGFSVFMALLWPACNPR